MTLYVQYTKNQTVKKWLPAELICAVYLEYIVIINFVRPYPNLLNFYVQSPRTKPSKSGFRMSLYVQHTRVHCNHLLCPTVPKFNDLICSVNKKQTVKKWLPFKLISAVYLKYIVTINFVRPYQDLLTL